VDKDTLRHPKVLHLARALSISILEARGLLTTLWAVTECMYPDGGIGRMEDEEIAAALDWPRNGLPLVEALVKCGIVDPLFEDCPARLYVHDWHEHCSPACHDAVTKLGGLFANGMVSVRCVLFDEEVSTLRQRKAAALATLHAGKILATIAAGIEQVSGWSSRKVALPSFEAKSTTHGSTVPVPDSPPNYIYTKG